MRWDAPSAGNTRFNNSLPTPADCVCGRTKNSVSFHAVAQNAARISDGCALFLQSKIRPPCHAICSKSGQRRHAYCRLLGRVLFSDERGCALSPGQILCRHFKNSIHDRCIRDGTASKSYIFPSLLSLFFVQNDAARGLMSVGDDDKSVRVCFGHDHAQKRSTNGRLTVQTGRPARRGRRDGRPAPARRRRSGRRWSVPGRAGCRRSACPTGYRGRLAPPPRRR